MFPLILLALLLHLLLVDSVSASSKYTAVASKHKRSNVSSQVHKRARPLAQGLGRRKAAPIAKPNLVDEDAYSEDDNDDDSDDERDAQAAADAALYSMENRDALTSSAIDEDDNDR
jgi:hypothetical protein